MSLHPQHPIGPVPKHTARIARAAFPKSNPYLTLRDTLGTVFADRDFADLYPEQGQPYEMHTSFSRLYGPAVLFWLSNAKKNCGTALSTTVHELSRKGPQIVTLATR